MLFDWLIKNQRIVYACFILFSISVVFGSKNVQISPDNRVFYGPDNSQFNEVLEFEANYTSTNNIIFVLHFSEPLSKPKHADALRWLTKEVWSVDNVIRVDSLASYPHVRGQNDEISIEKALDFYCRPNQSCADEFQEYIEGSNLQNRLISNDLHSAGVIATLNLDLGAIGIVEKISLQTENLVGSFRERFPDVEIVVTGGIPMMTAFATSGASDLSLLLPAALILITLMLFLFFGGLKPVFTLVGLSLLAALCTQGFSGWIGLTTNSATAIVPLVVFTIVTASSMHLVLHFLRNSENRTKQEDMQVEVRASLESNLAPMLVSAFTSIAGLLALSFVDSPPLQQLGQLSALGIAIGLVFAITILPLLLSKYGYGYRSLARSAIQQLLNLYARLIEQKRTYSLACFLTLLVLLLGFLRLEINDDFVDYFDKDTQFRIETDRATELLSGPNHIEVLLENDHEDGVFSPEYIQHLTQLTGFLAVHPEVSSVSSYLDVLRELSTAFETPIDGITNADEFAQWFLVYELSLQRGQTNTDFIRQDQRQSRVSILLRRTTSNQIKNLESAIYSWHADHNSPFTLRVTGENIPVAHLSEINIKAMISGFGISLLLIAFLVGILVRRLRLGVVALAGTLAPLILGFGAWGLLGQDIGLASTAIIAVTIGVAIDDAIHMIYRFLDAKSRLGLDRWHAAAYSVHRAGLAVATTSAVMIVGLSILLISSFKVNSSFGAVTCLIISIALIFDIFVLPRLLVWADKAPTDTNSELL